ncbi:hypothetical protein [Desulfitobacterium sp.]|uniref:hypothetical protein n=1 Tax=Desulfitobacterium sp. TaxID=49981 RepID=UPI002B1FC3B6|nr:hypothetical protein [Desulfitobacterium sp.]MEA4900918.1 hypothetical protein [Desulfitobacterium sp.]
MSISFITLSLIILIMIILFSFIKRAVKPRLNRFNQWKSNLLLAGGYLALLILLIPITGLLDKGESFISPNPDKELLALTPADWSKDGQKYHLPADGRFEEQTGLYENSHQTFKAEAPQLKITTAENLGNGQIFLERRGSADGIIEVATYVAPYYASANGAMPLDFTKLIAPPQISLEKGILKIERPIEQSWVFINFNDSFTVRQFKPEAQSAGGSSMMIQGQQGILVRIPSDLEIVSDDNTRVQWVR